MGDQSAFAALNKLARWRKFFASWQLGTRPAGDGEYKAVADAREMLILLRAEMSALTEVLMRKGVITEAEFGAALEREAKALDKDYADRFPGFSTSGYGLHMGREIAETYSRSPGFYGATYCCGCCRHLPVGPHGEFAWIEPDGSEAGNRVGA